ncbi:hypothetical protein ACJMK2_000866 [Sinanodonta woodiana]|uniref:C-type lectin domain-containing protein n=1 Tax=Sinanodonta woodiana TaxID=1069815 RepID=A0ABD3XQJ5_SINWO
MFPYKTMTGTYSLCAFVVLSLTASSFAQFASTCSTWDQDRDSENNLDKSVSLWVRNDCPLIDCAMRCTQDTSCMSFFHHPSQQLCLGTQTYKRALPSSQSTKDGWEYFTAPQQCDGLYVFNQTLGLCYRFHSENKTFDDAMAACEAEGAKLLMIRSQDEFDTIQKVINNTLPAGTNVFIGLRAISVNREWKWWNGQNASFIKWAAGEPNNSTGAENCVMTIKLLAYDVKCNSTRTFVCQKFIK